MKPIIFVRIDVETGRARRAPSLHEGAPSLNILLPSAGDVQPSVEVFLQPTGKVQPSVEGSLQPAGRVQPLVDMSLQPAGDVQLLVDSTLQPGYENLSPLPSVAFSEPFGVHRREGGVHRT